MKIANGIIGEVIAFIDSEFNLYSGKVEKIEHDPDWAYGSYKIIPIEGANFTHLRIFYYGGKKINYTVKKIGQTERREEQFGEPMVRGNDHPMSFCFIFDN
jgi:hypothetical protein